jgi:hypothetical protein
MAGERIHDIWMTYWRKELVEKTIEVDIENAIRDVIEGGLDKKENSR